MKMEEKKTLFFLPLLFSIFFLLTAITGIFQLRVIRENIDEFMKKEASMVIDYVSKQIDMNFEYLSIAEKIPSFNLLNVISYDEEIIDDFYFLFNNTSEQNLLNIPVENFKVFNMEGKLLAEKGNIKVKKQDVAMFLRKSQKTLIKTPHEKDKGFFMGFKTKDRVVFFYLDNTELDALRRKFIIKKILENEVERYNVSGIIIYDNKNNTYLSVSKNEMDTIKLAGVISSTFLPGFSIEVHLSRSIRDRIIKRATVNLVVILCLFIIAGGISTYLLFILMKRQEKKLEEIKRDMAMQERLVSLGNLASGMAHEIRNPLNAIGLSIQRLKREFMPEDEKKEEYQRFLDIIKAELTRVNKIVEDFLLTTKTQGSFSKENLFSLIDEVVLILKEEASIKGIEIINKVDNNLAVTCQKERLKQALYNIIINGIQAIKEKGKIYIEAQKRHNLVEILIKDTGPGIKKEDLKNIFDYYYTTKDKGIGMGLPISYMIVKDHGGNIKAISHEGEGATFIITLPVE